MENILSEIRAKKALQVDQALMLFETLKISDQATQLGTLNLIQKKMSEQAVYDKWCSLIGEEWTEPFVPQLLTTLSRHLYFGTVPKEWLPALLNKMPWLVKALGHGTYRAAALELLQIMISSTPENIPSLVSAWKDIEKNSQKDELLRYMFAARHQWPQAPEFFSNVLAADPLAIHEDWREFVISYLLEHKKIDLDMQIKYLRASEPEEVRIAIFNHWLAHKEDYDARKVAIASQLMRGDPSSWISLQSIMFLSLHIEHDETIPEQMFEKLRFAKDEWQRAYLKEALIAALGLPQRKEGLVHKIAALVPQTDDVEICKTCLEILAPLLTLQDETAKKVMGVFVQFLKPENSIELQTTILETIESVVHQNIFAVDYLLLHLKANNCEAYLVRIIEMLSPLTNLNEAQEGSLRELARQALNSSMPELRSAGLVFLTNMRLLPDSYDFLLDYSHLLLDTAIDLSTRKLFGHKLSKIPTASASGKALLDKVLKTLSADEFQYIHSDLTKLLARGGPVAADNQPPWADWLDRVQNGKPIDGIVPAVYIHYDKNPEKAVSLLKAMFFNNVYGWPRLANPTSILMFLLAKNAIDLEMANDAINFLLTKDDAWGSMNYHMMLLKNFKDLPHHKEKVWLVFERDGNHKRIDSALMREVLGFAEGTDAGIFNEMKKRISTKQSASDLKPYLHFIDENTGWAQAKDLVLAIEDMCFDKPQFEEDGNRDALNQLRLKLRMDKLRPGLIAEPVKKAGLLDD